MENSSIPSSSQETGRISTPWLKPLKQPNKAGRGGGLRRPLRGPHLRNSSDVAPDYDHGSEHDRFTRRTALGLRLRLRLRLRARARLGKPRRVDQDHEQDYDYEQCAFISLLGRWVFAFFVFWRVKGAWWPSRSSKPLSVRYSPGRGRFDSYPLRLFIFDFRFSIFDLGTSGSFAPGRHLSLSVGEAVTFPFAKGGEST
jgi:hypothetical protein